MRFRPGYFSGAFILMALFVPSLLDAQCVTEETQPVTTLSRRLLGRDNKPIAKVRISVFEDGTKKLLATTESDKKGAYRIKTLPVGKYRVILSSPGYIHHYYTLVVSKKSQCGVSEVHLSHRSECHDIGLPDDQPK